MLLAKMSGAPFESEMPATAFAPVPMPAAIRDISKARVMLITDGGLVPKGNPDRIEGTAATRWGSYNIEGSDDLRAEDYEVSHGGYDTRFVQEDPDRLVPLDALREMEKERRHRQAARRISFDLRPLQSVVEYAPPRPGDGGKNQTGRRRLRSF